MCTQNRKRILSSIETNSQDRVGWGLAPTAVVQLTQIGEIVEKELLDLNNRFSFAKIAEYVIMPNHIHLILCIDGDAVGASPHPTVTDIVCAFKSLSTRKCKGLGYKESVFQRSFFDRIIRNNDEYMEICNYIRQSPQNWETDELYN